MSNQKNTLQWRFDVNTFKLIGRDLITDRITALFELVKNSYDANAQKVEVQFFDVGKELLHSKIIIKDDGVGMSLDDIQNKWMVVGTASKRKTTHSSAPYNRRYVGEKGIGRFAVDKLGGKVVIRTKQRGEKQWLNVVINWEDYEKLASQDSFTLFTEVENSYYFEDAQDEKEQGTQLIITRIRENWTSDNLERLSKELTKIVSPFYPVNPPFDIYLYANEYEKKEIGGIKLDGKQPLRAEAINFYSHKAEISFHIDKDNPENSYQEILKFDDKNGRIYTEKTGIKEFGAVSMQLFFFNQEAKNKFKKYYKSIDDDTHIDGIKIYRDGIITTPFAETASHVDNQRDILGIHKRLWRDIFNRISTREVIGILDITAKNNPDIRDATNRQDFVDTVAYRELKEFIIEQLFVFENIKLYERTLKRIKIETGLDQAQEQFKDFEKQVTNIGKQINKEFEKLVPELKSTFEPLKNIIEPLKQQTKEIEKAYQKGVEQMREDRKEFLRKENMYLSLMSLQLYAVQVAHAIRTKLGSVKDMADFFKRRYPDAKFEEKFKEYAVRIADELQQLQHITDFMLSYAKAGVADIKEFNIKNVVTRLLTETYSLPFENTKITAIVEMEDCLMRGHQQFFQDIFQQLIANSIKALENTMDKKIRCSGYAAKDAYIILFSDNGFGVKQGTEERIFDLFYTTTAEQGGAGIGLWIAKNRIEALKGSIEVVENEFKPTGATFKITFPFSKN